MVDKSHAYNSVWQLRADAWCRLEEAAERLSRPTTSDQAEQYAAVVTDLLARLTPLEPYWAYPAHSSSQGPIGCSWRAGMTSSRRRWRGSIVR